ncbi:MAG: CHAT domain-containing protein, partial [Candidatus Omnitrophica bacterium]|nr:CHAT domain-containing protein [Candidatus Omnitrophota bacterium]
MIGTDHPQGLCLRVSRVRDETWLELSGSRNGHEPPLFEGPVPARFAEVGDLSSRILSKVRVTNLHGPKRDDGTSLARLGADLFDRLFPPELKDLLQRSRTESLLLVLDESLLGIPWELAHDGTDFLCCRYSLGRHVPSWQAAPSSIPRRAKEALSLLVVSNPRGELPSSTEEGRTISELAGSAAEIRCHWLNGHVDSKTTMEWMPCVDLLHYSGHGTPLGGRSGDQSWLLADGSFDCSCLREAGSRSSGIPYLVFSNACHSAMASLDGGRSGGSRCLAEDFIRLGCLHYIGSNSEVIDWRGSGFASSFYKRLFGGESVGAALLHARLEVRSDSGETDLGWAQYVLYGNPDTGVHGETTISLQLKTLVAIKFGGDNETRDSMDDLRSLLGGFPESFFTHSERSTCLAVFNLPSDAVRFALTLQHRAPEYVNKSGSLPLRAAICGGEVQIESAQGSTQPLAVRGLPVLTAEALLALTQHGQILLSRPVFDGVRPVLRGEQVARGARVEWMDHGAYRFSELEEPVGICEIGIRGAARLSPPPDMESARRYIAPGHESVLGWRPALDLEVPASPGWILAEQLGEGGFGEVWRAKHKTEDKTRVFKFCFHANKARSLKREATLFQMIRDALGGNTRTVQLHDVYFEKPPYFIQMEDAIGGSLNQWLASQGGVEAVPLELRLEIVAQAAEALQTAHDSGVIHRDVKPSNILMTTKGADLGSLDVKISDFGIGQVVSRDSIVGTPFGGFTETFSKTDMVSHSGTRLYMAPELLVGRPSSTRSDIYSLGVVLYQLLVGDLSRPLASDWREEITDPLLVQDLEVCLSGEPSKRLGAVGDLAERLRSLEKRRTETFEKERAERRRSRNRYMAVVASISVTVFFLLALALGFGLFRESRARQGAVREAYYATIGLAQAMITEGKVGSAQELLLGLPEDLRNWEWGWLLRLCNLDQASYTHPTSIPSQFDISRDGRFLAIGTHDGKVAVVDLETDEIRSSFQLTLSRPTRVAFDLSGKTLAASAGDGVTVFDVDTRQEVARLTDPPSFWHASHFHPLERLVGSPVDKRKHPLGLWS